MKNPVKSTFIDASKIMTEACVQSGADVFIGYPITPSNLYYAYAQKRFPMFYAAPDEITVLQWMAGFSTTGKFPVTATSFPGLALMTETLNMVYMMELPMLIIISQRLGPSTGSATTGAQGDLAFLNGVISGGYNFPVFCPSNFTDCWNLTHEAIKTAITFRTPVVMLTSKEMVMTNKSFSTSSLKPLSPIVTPKVKIEEPFQPYKTGKDLVPPMVPVGNNHYQARFNASTHDNTGLIRKGNPESISNTKRLHEKFIQRINKITFFYLDDPVPCDTLIVTYGISSYAAIDAVKKARKEGKKVSLLLMKTLLPIPQSTIEIINSYNKVIVVEENYTGQLQSILFGKIGRKGVTSVNKIAGMITPTEIENQLN